MKRSRSRIERRITDPCFIFLRRVKDRFPYYYELPDEDHDPVIDYLAAYGLITVKHQNDDDQPILSISITDDGLYELRKLRKRTLGDMVCRVITVNGLFLAPMNLLNALPADAPGYAELLVLCIFIPFICLMALCFGSFDRHSDPEYHPVKAFVGRHALAVYLLSYAVIVICIVALSNLFGS